MSRQDQFDQGLAALHEASLGDAHWMRAIVALEVACGGEANHICIVSGGESSGGIAFTAASSRILDPNEAEREYVSDYFPTDERIPRLFRLPHGHITPNEDLYTEYERKRTSATWNDFLCRLGTSNQLNVRLDGPDGSNILWALSRHVRSPDWQGEDFKMIRSFLPHVLHAVRVRQTLAAAEALGASAAGQLESPLLAVMLLDRYGKVVLASSRARQILSERDGLSDRGGVLAAHFAHDNARLGKLLARAVPGFGIEPTGGSTTVERPSYLPPFKLRVSPINVPHGDLGSRRAVAIVWVVDPLGRMEVDPRLLEDVLGLTAAQSRVAAALAEGRTVREIAAFHRIEKETVRWHLKQAFARTGCRSQSDLVRLVLSVAPMR